MPRITLKGQSISPLPLQFSRGSSGRASGQRWGPCLKTPAVGAQTPLPQPQSCAQSHQPEGTGSPSLQGTQLSSYSPRRSLQTSCKTRRQWRQSLPSGKGMAAGTATCDCTHGRWAMTAQSTCKHLTWDATWEGRENCGRPRPTPRPGPPGSRQRLLPPGTSEGVQGVILPKDKFPRTLWL